MKKETFRIGLDPDGLEYIFKAHDEATENHKETNNPILTGYMPDILDPNGRSHKFSPVKLFKMYLDHLNETSPFLWQTPNPAAFERGDHVWFKNIRLGQNKLGSFMSTLSISAQLSHKYTNHCIRVTGATNLTRAHFSANQIMSVMGHKSVNSLAMYQRVSGDEKMMMGMSLAFNLLRPVFIQQQLQGFNKQQHEEIKTGYVRPHPLDPPHTSSTPLRQIQPKGTCDKNKSSNATSVANINVDIPMKAVINQLPSMPGPEATPVVHSKDENFAEKLLDTIPKDALVTYKKSEGNDNFDLLKFLEDSDDENDMVMAATQVEKEYQQNNNQIVARTSNTIVRKSPQKNTILPFSTIVKLLTSIFISTRIKKNRYTSVKNTYMYCIKDVK